MKYNRQFLDIAEYASVAGSALGTVVAVASGQVAYAAAPLTLAISLNVVNRRSSVANLDQTVQSLQQKVQVLPAQPVNLNAITQSLQQMNQKTESLTQRFNARLEPRQIEELKETIAHLPHPQKVDLSPIAQSIKELKQSYETLTQQFNARPETQEIATLTEQLSALKLRLDNFPQPVDLSEIEAKLATQQAQLQAIDKSPINDIIFQLQSQIAQIRQQIQELPPPFDPSFLEERMQEQEERDRTITARYNRLVQLVQAEMARLRQSITEVQNSATTTVVEVRSSISGEIESLRATVHALPTPNEPVDLSEMEAEIETLKLQIQAIDLSSITNSIAQLQTELQTQINQVNHQIQHLPSPLDLDAIRQQLSGLDQRNRNLFNDYVERLVPAVRGLRSDRELTQQAIVDISNQLNALELKLNNLLIPPEPVDLSEIEGAITNLKYQLGELTQQFNTRSEPTAIERLDEMIALAIQRLDNLPPVPETVDITEVEELKTEVEQLEQRLQIVSRLDSEVKSLRQVLGQISEIQQQLNDLDVSSADLHDYARRLKNEVEQRIDQIHLATVELDERIQKFVQMPEQLEAVEQLSAGLDEKTTALDERTQNLAQTVQHLTVRLHEKTGHLDDMLTSLRQLVTECVKTGDFEGVLSTLSEQITGQVDTAVEQRLAGINQLLKDIQPQYEYKLVHNRDESRAFLLKAVRESQERLILVCPWLHWGIRWNYGELIGYFHALLQEQKGCINIGWGHRTDMENENFRNSSAPIRHRFKTCSRFYSALEDLEKLERHYPNHFKLKLLGTHEKFLVCDRSWAMLGSHNFLSSGDNSNERELGLQTNDPRIIANLILRFDSAKDLEQEGTFACLS